MVALLDTVKGVRRAAVQETRHRPSVHARGRGSCVRMTGPAHRPGPAADPWNIGQVVV
jgi:hypothetical protein